MAGAKATVAKRGEDIDVGLATADRPRRRRLVAIDDGHSETKVAYLDAGGIDLFSFPSRTIRGLVELDTSGGAGGVAYVATADADQRVTDDDILMVAPRNRSRDETGDNRANGFATSDRCRVLVHHALHQIAKAGDEFVIATTLPYSDFFGPDGAPDAELISRKKASLEKGVRVLDPNAERPMEKLLDPVYTLGPQFVLPEGMAAFFDVMLQLDDAGRIGVTPGFAERFHDEPGFLVIDIGGKTTDIVSGSWTGDAKAVPTIKRKGSESIRAGALDAADQVERLIKDRFGVRKVTDPEGALMRKTTPVYGTTRKIEDLVEAALQPTFLKIRDAVRLHAEDGSGLSYVIVVGGGAELMMEDLRKLFPESLVHVPNAPRFSNARGMLKSMIAKGLVNG